MSVNTVITTLALQQNGKPLYCDTGIPYSADDHGSFIDEENADLAALCKKTEYAVKDDHIFQPTAAETLGVFSCQFIHYLGKILKHSRDDKQTSSVSVTVSIQYYPTLMVCQPQTA